MNVIQKNEIINRINELHNKINNGLKTTVKWAIEIGKLLNEQKIICEHGFFLDWIDKTFNFSRDTANMYMRVNKYSNKCRNAIHLQDAYQLVYKEEKQEKKAQEIIQKDKILKYKKTGKKPDDWTRADDYQYKQYYDEEVRTKRIKKAFKEMDDKSIEREKKKAQEKMNDKIFDDNLQKALDIEKHRHEMYKKFETDGTLSGIFDVINVYLNSLTDNTRRIEASQSIIKFCRNKSIEYQSN